MTFALANGLRNIASDLGTVQVLSGVAPGGRELQIGFEDVSTVSGDSDFQNVVCSVRALDHGIL